MFYVDEPLFIFMENMQHENIIIVALLSGNGPLNKVHLDWTEHCQTDQDWFYKQCSGDSPLLSCESDWPSLFVNQVLRFSFPSNQFNAFP